MKKFCVPLTAIYYGEVSVEAADEETAIILANKMLNDNSFDVQLEYSKKSLQIEEDSIYEEEVL